MPQLNKRSPSTAPSALRRELGLRQAIAIGVGGTVGGGIFVLVGVAAGQAGPAALVAFALAFVAAALIALPYAELACRLPLAGGGYAYVHHVLGPGWGFLMGWGYWGGYLLISGYVTLGFGGYLHAATGLPPAAGAALLVAGITVINLLGVRISGGVQAGVVAVAVAGLLAFTAWGLPHTELANLRPFLPLGAHGVFVAALVAFLSFGGFDMVAAAGEEVVEPERNLPRAVLLTLGLVLGLYLAVAFVALATLPAAALGASPAPLADAARSFAGPAGQRLVIATALLTTAATANAVLVVTSRIAFAMGRDRLLPAWSGTVSRRTGAPALAVTANGMLMAAVAGLGTVHFATATGGFLYVLHFIPPLVALVALRRLDRDTPAVFSTPAPRLVIPMAFAASAALVVASGTTGIAFGTAWLAAGGAGRWLWTASQERRGSRT